MKGGSWVLGPPPDPYGLIPVYAPVFMSIWINDLWFSFPNDLSNSNPEIHVIHVLLSLYYAESISAWYNQGSVMCLLSILNQ